jgi:hypothetical protein
VSNGEITASVRILKFNSSKAWPPAAYAGLYQGADRSSSIQFLIIRNRNTDPNLVAGYGVVEGGCESQVESVENLPLDATAHVTLTFKDGMVMLKLNDGNVHRIRTPFTKVAPYVSVSPSIAEFLIAP